MYRRESRTSSYREATPPGHKSRQAPPQRYEGKARWEHEVSTPDTTLLFRYSALTFNGHRIHYDQAYARDVGRLSRFGGRTGRSRRRFCQQFAR